MKRILNLPELREEETRRMTEIEFYLHTEHLFETMGDKPTTYETIELFCRATNTSTILIKNIIANMRSANSVIKPTIDEIAVMMYRKGIPVSEISKRTDTSPNTIYRYVNNYYKKTQREYLPRIKAEHYTHIENFNKLLSGLMTYDEC